jgi:hypothetical protein
MRYEGFGPLCAAYAFLNTIRCPKAKPEEYELLSGEPFGVKHVSGDRHNLLSPFVDSFKTVEPTAQLFGYASCMDQFSLSADCVEFISLKPSGSRVMVGPIDMGRLLHLPQNLFYLGGSHYISIEVLSTDCFIVIDSEGVLAYKYNKKVLSSILSIEKIASANNYFHIWSFSEISSKTNPHEYPSLILRRAVTNLEKAEQAGEGSQAFNACFNAIKDISPSNWGLILFYDMNFQIQRQLLILQYLSRHLPNDIIDILKNQINVFYELRQQSFQKKSLNIDDFNKLADYERELLNKLQALRLQEI